MRASPSSGGWTRCDDRLGALLEQAGRLAACVLEDDASRRWHGVAVRAGQLQRPRVDPGRVPGEVLQEHGVIRADPVEVVPGRHPVGVGQALGEVAGVPPDADDPLARLGSSGGGAHDLGDVGDGGHGGVRDVEREGRGRQPVGAPVQVRVVDSRQQGGTGQVDDPGLRADERLDGGPVTDGADPPLGDGKRAGDGEIVVDRDDGAVDEDEIGELWHETSLGPTRVWADCASSARRAHRSVDRALPSATRRVPPVVSGAAVGRGS